jgi:hypothetical protein
VTYTVSQVAALKRIYTGSPGTMTASTPQTLTLAQWIANVGARHPKATAAAILSTAKADYAKQQAGLTTQAPAVSAAATIAGAVPTQPDSTTLPAAGADYSAVSGAPATGTAAPVSTVPTGSAAVGSTLPDLSSLLTSQSAAPATTSSTNAGLSITDLAIIGGTLIALIVAVRTKGKAK